MLGSGSKQRTFTWFLANEALLCVAHLVIPESKSRDIALGIEIFQIQFISGDYAQRKNSKNLVELKLVAICSQMAATLI